MVEEPGTYSTELVARPGEGRQGSTGPSGYRRFTQGYQVAAQTVGVPVQGGGKYRVRIACKAEHGANSLVGLRGRTVEGGSWETNLLANAFTDVWNDEVSAEVALPTDATRLEQVVFYRQNRKGWVWYGQVSVQRADLPAEGLDATSQLTGQPLVLKPGSVTIITARFEGTLTGIGPKLRVRLGPDAR